MGRVSKLPVLRGWGAGGICGRARGDKALLRRRLKITAGTRVPARGTRQGQQEAAIWGISADFAASALVAVGRRGSNQRPKPAICGTKTYCNWVASSVSGGTAGSYDGMPVRGVGTCAKGVRCQNEKEGIGGHVLCISRKMLCGGRLWMAKQDIESKW